jgi:hypothetical protein
MTFTPVGTGLTNRTLSFGLNKQPASVMVNMSGMGNKGSSVHAYRLWRGVVSGPALPFAIGRATRQWESDSPDGRHSSMSNRKGYTERFDDSDSVFGFDHWCCDGLYEG